MAQIALSVTPQAGPHYNPQTSGRIWFGSDPRNSVYYVTKLSFQIPSGWLGASLDINIVGRNDYAGGTILAGNQYNIAISSFDISSYENLPTADIIGKNSSSIDVNKTGGISATINKTLSSGTYYLYIWGKNPEYYSALTFYSASIDLNYTEVNEDTQVYIISYDPNGGNGAPENQIKIQGIDLILSNIIPTKNEFVFKGWSLNQSSSQAKYSPGDTFTLDKDTILYAVWGSDSEGWNHTENWNWDYNATLFNKDPIHLLTYTNNSNLTQAIQNCFIYLGSGNGYFNYGGSATTGTGLPFTVCAIDGDNESNQSNEIIITKKTSPTYTSSGSYADISDMQKISFIFSKPIIVKPGSSANIKFKFTKDVSDTIVICSDNYDSSGIRQEYGGDVINIGLVKIYANEKWQNAIPYIYDGTSWKQAIPYVYNNNKWNVCN